MKTLIYSLLLWFAMHTIGWNTDTRPENNEGVTINRNYFRLGSRLMVVEKMEPKKNHPYLLLSLHNNEKNAILTSRQFAAMHGLAFLQLKNDDRKNVEAELEERKICFDPNLIFTPYGRKENLKANDCWSAKIDETVTKLAKFIVDETGEGKTIVSIHTDGDRSIKDYVNTRNGLFKSVKKVFQNPAECINGYYITTDEEIYEKLKAKGMNVVLQDRKTSRDDGSFMAFCVKNNRSYVQIETFEDDIDTQRRLIWELDAVLRS